MSHRGNGKKLDSLSIRTHMIMIVLLMAVAMTGLIVFIGFEKRSNDIQDAKDLTIRLNKRVSADLNNLTANTELLLRTLSKLPIVQRRDGAAVSALLGEIVRDYPQYANILMTDKKGLLWASSIPFHGPVSYAERRYFINALATGHFSSGEYSTGKLLGKPIQTFALPVRDSSGQITGIVAVALGLEKYKIVLREQRFPEAASILLLDHQGTILYHTLRPDFIGKHDRTALFNRITQGPDEGVFQAVGNDGRYNIISYRKLWLPGEKAPYMYVRAAIPYDIAMKTANHELVVYLLLFLSIMLFVLGTTLYISKRYVVNKILALQGAAREIARGNLEVRVSDRVSGGELGDLGQTFDDMARSLDRDISRRRQTEEALQESETKYHDLYENAPDMYYTLDMAGIIQECNETFVQKTGYGREEIVGRSIFEMFDTDSIEDAKEAFLQFSLTGEVRNAERRVKCKDGRILDVSLNVTAIRDKEGKITHTRSLWHDITERKEYEKVIHSLSITDQLTGLYNRRGLLALAEQQLRMAARTKNGLLLLFADLDDLKDINDNFGHQAGDEALVEAAGIFREAFRKMDIIARLGGDEFAILMPEVKKDYADVARNRLQERIAVHSAQGGRGFTISMSIGMSSYDPENPCTIDELMSRADTLMYEQKKMRKTTAS